MKKGACGIQEPASGRDLADLGSVAAVLVPGIAFDIKGNRLGFGGGYFDKFLSRLPKKAKKIGLAFSCQVAKAVPHEKHDMRVDYLITENGVYKT